MTSWHLNPRIQFAAHQMWRGGVVGYPTEAVWGLGCDPFNQSAVMRILELKHRPVHKGLILIAAEMKQLGPLLEPLNDIQRQRLKNSWPGPVTWLVPHRGLIPQWVTGDFDTVALRVTSHPVAAALSRAFGGPLVSTSCNPQGMAPARNARQVHSYFVDELDAIAPGSVGKQQNPSEIRDLVSGKICRPG